MKLHIGCGKKYLPGFKHVDVIAFDHVDFVCDARRLEKIEDNSVSEIYACHILEHVERGEVVGVLREWARVLHPGGVLRLAVPDFEAVATEYLENRDLMNMQGLLYGGQTYDYNFHHVAFDFISVQSMLREAGFSKPERYDWRDFLPSENFDDYSRSYLPHMDFEQGRLMSLNITAKRL
ncbi:methyltransferase domain-containing protein [Mariprofundus sp. EBB-1]|uniref:class I SAM-dependent methyltransferase n=1 Tax=Mariprofundus sp. EBB-1 TaxID=2650971 RepID=UPI000EF1EC9C|nr:methyltransferase domain-containing protein [Mariprofundus sp. EBB-1]RLL51944.1 methyltransferase domain-containing protein [Mariprofundus sp. EBB-1]